MKADSIEPGTVRVARDHWILKSFAAIDAKDIDSFIDMLTDDHRFVFGHRSPVIGKVDAREQILHFWSLIGRIRHNIKRLTIASEDLVFVESEIDYERLDGHSVTLPGCVAIGTRGSLICEQRAYLDQSPLWAEIVEEPVRWAQLRQEIP